ncbi:MAG TPA: TolC family protein [Clostridium sp.]
MRKNINKLVAFAIGISIMGGSIVPVFAADTTTKNTSTITSVQAQTSGKTVLTLDSAIEAAISNDSKMQSQIKYINLQDDKLDIADDINDINSNDANQNAYDTQELLVKQAKQKKDFMEDILAQHITDKYNDLVAQGKALDKIKRQIEIKTKEVSDAQLKKKLGLITSIDLTQAQIQIETLKNSQKDAENKLKNSQDYFQVLTGKDLSKYALAQDTDFETFKIDGSVDDYFNNLVDKYFEYSDEILGITKDYIKDHKMEHPSSDDYVKSEVDGNGNPIEVPDDGAYVGALQTYASYLEGKYNNLDSKLLTVQDSKKSINNGLKVSYASLLNLENSINVMKSNIQVSNKQLSNAKLQYDLGMITKTQYDNQVVANKDLDTNLRGLIDNYNKLKNNIQKPWILVDSSGTTAQ